MHFLIATALTCLLSLAAALPTQPLASDNTSESIPIPVPTPSTPHLEMRQGVPVTAVPVAATANPGQISPVTTLNIGYVKDGVYTQIIEVYTQTFALVPDQWPAATQGAIGLGTIQGEIGVVKTKRDLPMQTQLP